MKVILLQDVKGQGKKGDLINASDGYARNFLLPRKLAKEADAGSIKQIEIQKESEAFHIAEEKRKAEETRAFLSGKSIRFKTTGGADGRRRYGKGCKRKDRLRTGARYRQASYHHFRHDKNNRRIYRQDQALSGDFRRAEAYRGGMIKFFGSIYNGGT